jgi:hypothetical protein
MSFAPELDAFGVFECACCARDTPVEVDSFIVLNGTSEVIEFACGTCVQDSRITSLYGIYGPVWIKPSGQTHWVHHVLERPKQARASREMFEKNHKYRNQFPGGFPGRSWWWSR